MLSLRRTVLIFFAMALISLWAGCGMTSSTAGPSSGGLFPLPPPTPTPVGVQCAVTIAGRVYDGTSSTGIVDRVLIAGAVSSPSLAYPDDPSVQRYFPSDVTVPLSYGNNYGNFALCISTVPSQGGLAVVMSSKTSGGKFFGPTVILIPASAVQSSIQLGDVRIAGNQPEGYEPPEPTTVNIPITSTPLQVDGMLWALTTIADPNNPSQTAEIGVPIMTDPLLIRDGAETFHTVWPAPNSTTATASPAIRLPSERPWVRDESTHTYSQSPGELAYRIVIVEDEGTYEPPCDQHWIETASMSDTTPLLASPGAAVTTSTIAFTGCIAH